MSEPMSSFVHEGHRIAYREHGAGEHVVVLAHGLLFDQKLMTPLARSLGKRGYRTITIDLLGHGASDRPKEMQAYSMTGYGEQMVGLLDHLEVDQAVLGGLSLGANATLEACALAPERVRGAIVHMPVLDNALLGCAVGFSPLLLALTFGHRGMRALMHVTKALPTSGIPLADTMLQPVRQDPKPSASLMQGIFFARVAPPTEIRRTFEMPALVIGHDRDPIHPFSDADTLVQEMPNARLVHSTSIAELMLSPKHLRDEIVTFLEEVHSTSARPRSKRTSGTRRPRVA